MSSTSWARVRASVGMIALVVGLLLASVGAPAGAAPPGQTEISGTVTAQIFGNPISGVVVMALDGTQDYVVGSTVTAADGTYSLLAPSGTGRLLFLDPANGHVATVSPATSSPPIAFPDGGDITINVTMTRAVGGIEGRLTDSTSGTGIPAGVALSTNAATGMVDGGAATDGLGFFVSRGLPSVPHKVSFFDLAGAHEVEYYNNKASFGSADPVNVVGGALQVIGTQTLDAKTAPTGAVVQGTVTGAGGVALSNVVALVYNAGTGAYEAGAITDGAGQYSVAVGAGQYQVRFVDLVADGQASPPHAHHLAEWYGDAPDSPTPAGATVTAPGTADAVLGLARGTIAGTITEDVTGDPLEDVWVLAIDASGIVSQGVTAADGTYSIPNVPVSGVKLWITDLTGTYPPEYYDNIVGRGFGHDAGVPTVSVTGGATTTANATLGPIVESATVTAACGSVTVATSDGTLDDVAASAVPVTPPPPGHLTFPCGLIGFDVEGLAPASTVTITIDVPTAFDGYWKLHDGAYTQVTGAVISVDTVTFEVTDGGALDEDGIANGRIVDPGGPTLAAPVTPGGDPTTTGLRLTFTG